MHAGCIFASGKGVMSEQCCTVAGVVNNIAEICDVSGPSLKADVQELRDR